MFASPCRVTRESTVEDSKSSCIIAGKLLSVPTLNHVKLISIVCVCVSGDFCLLFFLTPGSFGDCLTKRSVLHRSLKM